MFDIYATTHTSSDGQRFSLVTIDHPDLYYLNVQSFSDDVIDIKNAEIYALQVASSIASRLGLLGSQITLFHSFDTVIEEDNKIKQGNVESAVEAFYCGMESMTIENLLFLKDSKSNFTMVKIPQERNLAKETIGELDLGYHVSIDDLQIMDKQLAEAYLANIIRF